jgi:hypothetical protein
MQDQALAYANLQPRQLPCFLNALQITKVGKGGKLLDGAGAPSETTVEDLIRVVLKLAPTDSAVRAVEKVGQAQVTTPGRWELGCEQLHPQQRM